MLSIMPTTLTRSDLNAMTYVFYGGAGAGMIPLMQWLLDGGAQVYSIDDGVSPVIDSRIKQLTHLEQIPDSCHAAVYTTGLPKNHPFFAWCSQNVDRLRLCCSRPQFLQEVSRLYDVIAITGTHGKTNASTAMSWILDQQGRSADYLIGGKRSDTDRYGHQQAGADLLVIEADESQTTLQYYSPAIAIILNSFGDHLEFFDQQHQKYHDNIHAFMMKSPIVIIDAQTAQAHQWQHPHAYYFNSEGVTTPDGCFLALTAPCLSSGMALINKTPHAWQFQAAALALCHALSVPLPDADCWLNYHGVAYRLEQLAGSASVLRDYGHHPRELLSVYHTLKSAYPEHKLRIIFQPHKYSRTKREQEGFMSVLSQYDQIYLLPTEAAGETLEPAYESDCLLQGLDIDKAQYLSDWDDLRHIHLEENTITLFQGAGRIMRYAQEWAEHKAAL